MQKLPSEPATSPPKDTASKTPLLFRWRTAIANSDLPATTRLVLFTLSLHMDGEGRDCFPSTKLLAKETGLSKRTVCTRLVEEETRRWVRIEEGRIRPGQAWKRHQYSPLLPEGGEIASPPFEGKVGKLVREGGEADDNKVGKQLHSSSSLSSSGSASHPSVSRKRKPQVEDSLGFDAFWSAYPRRVAKQAALKAWRKLNPDGELQAVILRALGVQRKTKD